MRTILSFDEINKPKSMPFDQYFGEMNLTKRQKEERIALARGLEAVFLYFFDAVLLYLNDGIGNPTTLLTLLITELSEVLDENRIQDKVERSTVVPDVIAALLYRPSDDFVSLYSVRFAQEVLDSTLRNIDKPEFLSEDRARNLAEEDSNSIYNHVDFVIAKAKGKTRKRWITMRDSKVRTTHRAVESKTIPIDDFFDVGNANLLYPRDIVNGASHPEEIAGCRCSIVYY